MYTEESMHLTSSKISQPIEVYAIEENKTFLAGKCWLRSNNKRYEIKIALVNCQTNLTSGVNIANEGLPSSPASKREKAKKILNNFLNQMLIKCDFVEADLPLQNDPKFKSGVSGSFIVNNLEIDPTDDMFNYCLGKINPLIGDLNVRCVILFFNEPGHNAIGRSQGIGGANGASIFRDGVQENTIAHEALHSIGLYHSFDNNGEFTFEIYKVDNIMDYLKFQPDSKRKLTWYWQDKKVKSTSNNNKLKLV
ncbi:hypothetical protein [uncultured Chryseobacterium sp.]|uniref:hypothetical protein n=1 Tax=uncultured Chryseobacterium sp. TaxID=259322 RepID=UPI0025D1954D|nr:hypothetical protein [uncultured Chryseobacterium sp.]